MTKDRQDVIQAVPLIRGQINVGVGTYTAKCLIHCETDAVISLQFPIPVDYTMVAGMDRGFQGEFKVVSGTVTYD